MTKSNFSSATEHSLVATHNDPASRSSFARPASLLATGIKKQFIGGQSLPARPSKRASTGPSADESIVFNEAESLHRRRRWAVSEKSGKDFSEGPSSEADTLSIFYLHSWLHLPRLDVFSHFTVPSFGKLTFMFSHSLSVGRTSAGGGDSAIKYRGRSPGGGEAAGRLCYD